jgi:Protein of unknown function (DUF3602)
MPVSSLYQLVEPHPQVVTPYIHTARGGAGNIASASSTTDGSNARGPASCQPCLKKSKRSIFTSGRGGLGNIHSNSERAIFSFDEELERDMRQTQDLAPVCYVGRGGAGNKVYLDPWARRKPSLSSDTDSIDSTSTTSSESGAVAFNRTLKKGWGRVVGGNHMT